MPEVDSVTRRRDRPYALSSRNTDSAVTTLSKFASGSPIPIITTFVIGARPCATQGALLPSASSVRLACQSWPMISAAVRLRLKPCLPVEQKAQSSAQPACDEMHSVPRSSSGMYTASTALPRSTSSSHLRVPSGAVASPTTAGAAMIALASSFSRRTLARSVSA